MQYLVTIIAPDDSEHEFVLPQDKPLRELIYSILIHLKLPLTLYEVIDTKTGEYLPLDNTLRELFEDKEATLRLEDWQARIRRSVEERERYVEIHREEIRAKTHKAKETYMVFMLGLFLICTVTGIASNREEETNPARRSFEKFQEYIVEESSDASNLICSDYRDNAHLEFLQRHIHEYQVVDYSSYITTAWLTLEREDDSEVKEPRIVDRRTVQMQFESGHWRVCDAAFLGITVSE